MFWLQESMESLGVGSELMNMVACVRALCIVTARNHASPFPLPLYSCLLPAGINRVGPGGDRGWMDQAQQSLVATHINLMERFRGMEQHMLPRYHSFCNGNTRLATHRQAFVCVPFCWAIHLMHLCIHVRRSLG